MRFTLVLMVLLLSGMTMVGCKSTGHGHGHDHGAACCGADPSQCCGKAAMTCADCKDGQMCEACEAKAKAKAQTKYK